MWSLKRNDTNELAQQKATQKLRKLTYGYQREGREEEIVREFGVDMYTLYLKRITNKDLLYSTWNSARESPIATANTKHSQK